MSDLNDCLYHYNKLKKLLEEDYSVIGNALQGDTLEAYRQLIRREEEQIDKATSILKRLL